MEKFESVNKYCKFWLDENQIYHLKYHPGAVIDLEIAQFISTERKKIFNGKRYHNLIDCRSVKFISHEAKKYFSSPDNVEFFIARAFLIDSFLSRMLVNSYFKLYPSIVPTKLFTNKEEAIKWLLKYQ